MKLVYDLTGNKYGRLAPLYYVYKNKRVYWYCECDCGNYIFVAAIHLVSGKTQSCKCYQKERRIESKKVQHEIINSIEHKKCCYCDEFFSLDNYGKDNTKWDGLKSLCKKCVNLVNKKSKIKNRENVLLSSKKYHSLHKEEEKKYRQENKEYFSQKANIRSYNRRRSDINYRLIGVLRARVRMALKNNSKGASTIELIGCTIEELKRHLENQFDENMTWENHGSYWHIDHIIPCAVFDLSDVEQQKICFNYTNMQPLEVSKNFSKSDFLDNGLRGRNVKIQTDRSNMA